MRNYTIEELFFDNRASLCLTFDEISFKINEKVELIILSEVNAKKIPLNILEKLARLYKINEIELYKLLPIEK